MRLDTFLAVAFSAFCGLLYLFLVSGCAVKGPTYVEGTRFRMGVYVPWDGQLYGLQVIEYLNGAAMAAPSNQTATVAREHCATNSYLGIVHTVEQTKTCAKSR